MSPAGSSDVGVLPLPSLSLTFAVLGVAVAGIVILWLVNVPRIMTDLSTRLGTPQPLTCSARDVVAILGAVTIELIFPVLSLFVLLTLVSYFWQINSRLDDTIRNLEDITFVETWLNRILHWFGVDFRTVFTNISIAGHAIAKALRAVQAPTLKLLQTIVFGFYVPLFGYFLRQRGRRLNLARALLLEIEVGYRTTASSANWPNTRAAALRPVRPILTIPDQPYLFLHPMREALVDLDPDILRALTAFREQDSNFSAGWRALGSDAFLVADLVRKTRYLDLLEQNLWPDYESAAHRVLVKLSLYTSLRKWIPA